MKDISLYEKIPVEEKNFPLRLLCFEKKGKGAKLMWHEHIELLFFLSDGGIVTCGNERFNVKKNDLIFVNSNELHAIELPTLTKYYCMIINPSFFADVSCDNVLFKPYISNDPYVCECFLRIFDEFFKKSEGWDMAVKGSAYNLMSHLLRNYKLAELPEKTYNAHMTKLKRINSVLHFISEHYQEKLTTATLAKQCYLSEYYFCRFFKSETGMSVMNYINQIRVDKAEILLHNTSDSITDIAMSVGFDDVNYFARVFKKYKQMSPSEYRNHLLTKNNI